MKKIAIFLMLVLNIINAKTIAKIPEASGICFVDETKTLVVVNDEGWIYEISKKGKILRKVYLGKYDLEGIAYDKSNQKLLIAVEAKESILIVNKDSFAIEKEIEIKRSFDGVKVLKKSKGSGLEAIAIDENGDIYVSNQSKITYKKNLKENASVILKIKNLKKKKTKIKKVYNHGYVDIAGMTFHNGYLYMTSDTKNLLIKYDLKTNKTIAKIKLKKSAQEGICFDNKNNIYIANDNGTVIKMKAKKLHSKLLF
ncbi:MAG: SdiA-regulated domain-containing protein [Campylobacterota bacterium]|nr:SdiA-regulated domain-containing protein [Campylobacterota bacterium]